MHQGPGLKERDKQMKRKRVGIVIFPEVEVLDFCGPYEVFTVTRLDEARRREEPSPFQVLLVAEREEAIATAAGMRVLPDCALAACPPLDILVVPGGWGTRRQMQNETLIDWLARRGRQDCWTGAGPPPTGAPLRCCGSPSHW